MHNWWYLTPDVFVLFGYKSLYYAKMTGHKPAVAIIMKTPQDEKNIKRIQTADERITVFKIKANE